MPIDPNFAIPRTSNYNPKKKTLCLDTDGKLLLCCCAPPCDDPPNPQEGCDCLTSLVAEFNMLRGVSRANGVWRVTPVYDLQGYQGTAKYAPSDNAIYYHEPDTNHPSYDPLSPNVTPQIFDNGTWLGSEYVNFFGADPCTAWNYLEIKCSNGPWPIGTMRHWNGVFPPYSKYDTWTSNDGSSQFFTVDSSANIRQADEMYAFGSGANVRHPYLGFPYYGSGDSGDTNPDCGTDQHSTCGTTKTKQKATITIGDQTYTTLSNGSGFTMTSRCISPRQGFASAINGSYNAGGITTGQRPFPGLPQALAGGSNDAECPRMNVAVELFFNCNGTVAWNLQGLQSLKTSDVGANNPYRYEITKNFGQATGQPVLIFGTWDPDSASSSGQIPALIRTKFNGLPDSDSTVYIDWSISQE